MNAKSKERLFEILINEHRAKYPGVPDHCRAIKIHPDTNEKGIKNNIKAFCGAMKFKFSVTESKAKASVKIDRMTHASGMNFNKISVNYVKSEFEKGHHDIEISKNNQLWCIEIKAQNKRTNYKDKQSDVQKSFEKKMNQEFGNDYYIIRGIDDFFELYDNKIKNNSNN